MDNILPFNKPYIVGKELFYIAQAVISNCHISGDGTFTKKCQNWLEKNLGTHRALMTHSCTAALEMSALLCNIKSGDEIIMPSYTFVSTANAFVLRGGIPVFVDIREDTLNIDESLIQQAVSEKTKAIVPVHYAGNACDMEAIMSLAKSERLLVIEDAAQALLSKFHGRNLGTIGDLGCLSFHETKNIISGEGGAILINNPELLERAEIIWEKGTNRKRFFQGQIDKYSWIDIGSSFLPSDIISAFLYGQLEMAENIISKRYRLFETYLDGLKEMADTGRIRLPYIDQGNETNGHIMYIITNSNEERSNLMEHLREKNISAVFHYIPLHSSLMGREHCRVSGKMSVTNRISNCLLRLPMFYEMQKSDVERVVDAVMDFYNRR